MGTNFYAKIKMTSRDSNRLMSHLKDMEELLNNGDVIRFGDELHDLHNDFRDIKNETIIHLGKRSYGWAFLWDLNEMQFYKPELKSIINFLKKKDAIIENEYGKQFTIDDFINEIKYCLYPSEKPITEEDLMLCDTILDYKKEYILDNYINKGIPYYKYCTSKTFHEMHPDEHTENYLHIENYLYTQYQHYSNSTIINGDTDFVTKDNIRCATYTNFS